MTIRTAGQSIQATVTGGSFAAWWPAAQTPPNAPGPAEAYDLTLTNGRVVKDAPTPATRGVRLVRARRSSLGPARSRPSRKGAVPPRAVRGS